MKKAFLYLLAILIPSIGMNLVALPPKKDTVGFNKKKARYGDFAHGGVVIYVTPDGLSGLVVAIEDVEGTYPWTPTGDSTADCGADFNEGLPVESGILYPGQKNTTAILNYYAANDNPYAAKAAANYSVTIDGITYDDWFLPSVREGAIMVASVGVINEVSAANGGSEMSEDNWASLQDQTSPGLYSMVLRLSRQASTQFNKSNTYKVRPVRVFNQF